MTGIVRSLLSGGVDQDAPSANAILNALPHPVLFLDADLQIQMMNQEAETFFKAVRRF